MEEKSKRGFGALTPEKRREISSKGGKASHAQGRAHRFTVEEARIAGRKGGAAVAANREHMRQIGKTGGQANKRETAQTTDE